MEEIWKDIKGYEGIYQISNLGMVKSLYREIKTVNSQYFYKEKFLKTTPNNMGYHVVRLTLNNKTKSYSIHRLLAIHFIENIDNKPQVNHINGIKVDNRLENLEWCTISENRQHAYDTGLQKPKQGNRNGRSKLTENQVLEIIKRLEIGDSCVLIASFYNVTAENISQIKQRKIWRHIFI